MDLNILPPDTDTFVTKKQTSERQKAHLKKAREIAKQRQIKPKNEEINDNHSCLLYTSPSPRDRQKSRMPSSA